MGTAAKKPRPKRSKRSGVKKFKQYMANWAILKKLGFFSLLIVFFMSCDTPYKVIETYSTDSTGKTVKTVQKLYSNNNDVPPPASLNIISSPFFYNPYPYYGCAYAAPRIIVPIRPVIIPRNHIRH